MIIDIAWIYTVGFGMIFLCQQLSHWNCAIPTYKSRAQSRWTERKREEAKGTFFSSQQSCNFDSFLSLQGFVFFIIDLCKKKCEWLCTYYLTSWMFILQVYSLLILLLFQIFFTCLLSFVSLQTEIKIMFTT